LDDGEMLRIFVGVFKDVSLEAYARQCPTAIADEHDPIHESGRVGDDGHRFRHE
jgi:hypothetical protein